MKASASILHEANVKFSEIALCLKITFYTAVFTCAREKGESASDTAHVGGGGRTAGALIGPQSGTNKLATIGTQTALLNSRGHIQVARRCYKEGDLRSPFGA